MKFVTMNDSGPNPPPALSRHPSLRTLWISLGFGGVLLAVLLFVFQEGEVKSPPSLAFEGNSTSLRASPSCRECHPSAYADWAQTDHALANRPPTDEHLAALARFPRPEELTAGASGRPVLILGHAPVWQPLVPAAGGRWQAHELAFDPNRKEWFNVFGEEKRTPGEWGHWTGRGMNWNTMCAPCHMTGYDAGYDASNDTFHSTWIEQGVGCVRCHGDPPAGHGLSGASKSVNHFSALVGDRSRAMQTCAPCHARNEPLTTNMKPGEYYHDHHRVTLPVDPLTLYPDGQQRDEDFNWTSVLTSRMGHAGVTCLDCHDPHSTKTILPVQNNALCMQCHSPPGRIMPGGARATVINPEAHSHHAKDSPGNQCVSCHMPTTNYMQRSPRHDHGWIKPDPLLTKELGIPNSCSKCHEKEGLDWVIAKADAWYGSKLDSAQRARTRAVAGLQSGNPDVVPLALAALAKEDVPAWRATLLELLSPHVAEPAVRSALQAGLGASDPLERAAAVRALSGQPDFRPLLRPLLNDPVRLVRLDAALALTDELAGESAARRELDAYLHLQADQPAGLARVAFDAARRGRLDEANTALSRAAEWDPGSSALRDYLGQLQLNRGNPSEAAARFAEAARLAPADANAPYRAALAFAEAGQRDAAEAHFRIAVTRDPALDRAWYNLGLLLAQKGEVPEALAALARAEALNPQIADYPYATATLHWQAGKRDQAREAARRALVADPAHQPARRLIAIP